MRAMNIPEENLTELLQELSRQSVLHWENGHIAIHSLTMAAILATNPKDILAEVIRRALSRLIKVNTDDPVSLRDEIIHFEYFFLQAKNASGFEDNLTLSYANSLAIGYRSAGRPDEAIELDEKTLEIMGRVLGPEHPDTLSSRGNLAADYRAKGRLDEAIELDVENA